MTERDAISWLWLLLGMFLFPTVPCFSQAAMQDSLLARHLNENLPDTARLRALIALGKTHYRPDSLLYYHEEFAAIFQEKGEPAEQLERAIQMHSAYFRIEQSEKGLPHAEHAEALAVELGDTIRWASSLIRQGNCHGAAYRIDLAIEKYKQAIAIAETIGNANVLADGRGNMGILYRILGEYDQAIAYFQLNLANSQSPMGKCRDLLNIGATYKEAGDYRKALVSLRQAYDIAEEHDNQGMNAWIVADIGECQLGLQDYSAAQKSFHNSLSIAQKMNMPGVVVRNQLGLARIFRQSKPDSALLQAEQALTAAQQIDDLGIQTAASKLLYELYEERAQYRMAVNMQSQWKILQDSMSRMENQRAVADIEARSAYEKQKLADDLAHQEQVAQQKLAAQRRFYALLGGAILIVLGLLSLLRIRRESSQQERRKLLYEIDLLKERVAARSVTASGVPDDLNLDRQQIEAHLGHSLGESSWLILSLVFENPSISNKEIAAKVFLSLEGVSSSLRRMYKAFQVQSKSKHNMKVALATKAAKISLDV